MRSMSNPSIEVKHEDDLRRLYGFETCGIDYLIITSFGIIPIQIKYRGTRRRETQGVYNFLNSVEKVKKYTEKPVLFGVWISRLQPFRDNMELLAASRIECIDDFSDMHNLITMSVETIISKLHKLY